MRTPIFFFFRVGFDFYPKADLFLVHFLVDKKSKVLPGLEPGLQGSEPWVLTNYTIEPAYHNKNKNAVCGVRTHALTNTRLKRAP